LPKTKLFTLGRDYGRRKKGPEPYYILRPQENWYLLKKKLSSRAKQNKKGCIKKTAYRLGKPFTPKKNKRKKISLLIKVENGIKALIDFCLSSKKMKTKNSAPLEEICSFSLKKKIKIINYGNSYQNKGKFALFLSKIAAYMNFLILLAAQPQ